MKRFAAAAAVLGWTGLGLQLYMTIGLSLAAGRSLAGGLVTFFSYFTILTNVLAAVALTAAARTARGRLARFLSHPAVQSGVAVNITVVAIVYHLLLRNQWDPRGTALVADTLLHSVTPLLFVTYWWVAVPKSGLRAAHVLYWMLYPAAYFVVTMVRGAFSGIYPYPFIDAGALGARGVSVNVLAILLGFGLLSALFLAAGRRRPVA